MIGATRNRQKPELVLFAGLDESRNNFWGTIGRCVGIHQFGMNRNLTLGGDGAAHLIERFHHAVATRKLCVANINAKTHLGRNTVDRSGKDIAHADRCDGVDRASRFGG